MPDAYPPETGENDMSSDDSPLTLVLVRGLNPRIDENVFAKGMEKFNKGFDDIPGGAEEKSLRRVFLIKDRQSEHGMGYGFAEYRTVRDAQAVVRKEPDMKNAKKCTIGSHEITLGFPHRGVFPHADFGRPEYNEKYTFAMPNSERRHKYRDDRYYASEYMVNSDPPASLFTAAQNNSSSESKSVKTGEKRGMETLESKAKKVKSSATAAPAFLQHWQNKQAELRGEPDKTAPSEPKQPASGVNTIEAAAPAPESVEEEQTFAYEGDIIGCYLCGSTFTSKDSILKHLNQSNLHANNLKDESIRDRGYQRLKKKEIDPEKTIKLPKTPAAKQAAQPPGGSKDTTGEYRDRAAERRQEEIKSIGFPLKGTNQKKKAGNASGPSSDNEAPKPTYGKGMNMLQKGGWSEGEGLGSGGGITAPIDQSLYASGVGLGHESSKKGDAVEEASRMTKNDRGEFLEKTKELARKRYEKME